jgi:four helix bundle protein
MRIGSYEDLTVWRAAMALIDGVYRESRALPGDERFGLTAQMRRAATSVAANIAEGYGRLHRGDYVRHLSFASGSLSELETHLRIAQRQGFLPVESVAVLLADAAHVGRMLRALRRSLGAPH